MKTRAAGPLAMNPHGVCVYVCVYVCVSMCV
jgi:hypothetical protein